MKTANQLETDVKWWEAEVKKLEEEIRDAKEKHEEFARKEKEYYSKIPRLEGELRIANGTLGQRKREHEQAVRTEQEKK